MAATTVSRQTPARMVDLNALRTNQCFIVGVVLVAFVLGVDRGGAWLVALLAVSMAIGAAKPGSGPIQLFYHHLLLPTGLVHPAGRNEDPAPHRFAQAVGAAFLTVSAVLLFAGATTLGWLLAAIVVALALTNLVFGFCAGCFVFLQLRKTGLVS
jgi:hypothetical protein